MRCRSLSDTRQGAAPTSWTLQVESIKKIRHPPFCSPDCGEVVETSVAKHYGEQRAIYVQTAVVFNKTEFPEFIHEIADSGSSCANHLRQSLLAHFGNHGLGLGIFAIMGKQ